MSITTLSEAKLHLRVDHSDEDSLIQIYLDAAEQTAFNLIDRNVYADSTALTSAQSGAAAALTTATTAYEAAMTAAALIENEIERQAAEDAAHAALLNAHQVNRRTNAGIVMNSDIKAAVLLLLGHLYANREATTMNVTTLNVVEAPMGVRFLLQRHANYQ